MELRVDVSPTHHIYKSDDGSDEEEFDQVPKMALQEWNTPELL